MKQTKAFPWRCAECGKREVYPGTVQDYVAQVKHDGRSHEIRIPELAVPRCGACGAVHMDVQADDQIWAALRTQLGLLSPDLIRTWRNDRLKLTQREFARRLGVAPETVCRWESGSLIQSRAYDNLMRLFFGLPEVRNALAAPDLHLRELEFVEDFQVATWALRAAGIPSESFEITAEFTPSEEMHVSYEMAGAADLEACGKLAA